MSLTVVCDSEIQEVIETWEEKGYRLVDKRINIDGYWTLVFKHCG